MTPRRAAQETPPLTRGRQLLNLESLTKVRNTPAYAGKTPEEVQSDGFSGKHPRLRGEDAPFAWPATSRPETPPLTRGRHEHGFNLRPLRGNTPAYAGKTFRTSSIVGSERKHPRLRGEDFVARDTNRRAVETPPLTRGRRAHVREEETSNGNTPAYAGKTLANSQPQLELRKHPRLRGED